MHLFAFVLVFTLFGTSQSVDTTSTGGPIEYADVQSGLAFTLLIDEYSYVGPTVTQNTRAYNGDIIGPTLRVSPGTTITVSLTNNLNAQGFSTASLHNEFREISVTNLHTHGLHINGIAPGDSIFTEVLAGASYTYTYVIPADHMGGTFWYHPHHHGSTAIQSGGGACGMIIIEDPINYLPTEISDMEERLFLLQHLNMPELSVISQEYETNCQNAGGTTAQCDDPAWAAGPTSGTATNIVLVNGMTQPVISLEANKWYRFRMVYAAVDSVIKPWVDGCTIQLMAKDGVYLHTMPRTITSTFMGPGSRADWAISCPAGTYTMESGAVAGRRMQGGKMAGGGAGNAEVVQTLASLTVSESTAVATTLTPVNVARPCYLVDLRTTTAASTTAIDLGPAPQINGKSFASATTYEASFAVGSVHQIVLGGINAHPFHLHVNHFQLQTSPTATEGDYFLSGDWHDVLIFTDNGINVRFQADRYTGAQVIHCHILEHEDEGMMLVTQLTGTEGTTFTGAEAIDSTCYRAAYSGTVPTGVSPSPSSPPSSPDDPCFPSSGIVTLADGTLTRLDALSEGDAIAVVTKDGILTTDTVSLFSIAKPEAKATFITLRTDNNQTLTLTPGHHLSVGNTCCTTLIKAKHVTIGDSLWTLTHDFGEPSQQRVQESTDPLHSALHTAPTRATVVGKTATIDKGLHSPVMTHGTFPIVDGIVTAFDSMEGIALAEVGLASLVMILKATGTASLARTLFFPSGKEYIDTRTTGHALMMVVADAVSVSN